MRLYCIILVFVLGECDKKISKHTLHSTTNISANIGPIDTRQLSLDKFLYVDENDINNINAERVHDEILILIDDVLSILVKELVVDNSVG